MGYGQVHCNEFFGSVLVITVLVSRTGNKFRGTVRGIVGKSSTCLRHQSVYLHQFTLHQSDRHFAVVVVVFRFFHAPKTVTKTKACIQK